MLQATCFGNKCQVSKREIKQLKSEFSNAIIDLVPFSSNNSPEIELPNQRLVDVDKVSISRLV